MGTLPDWLTALNGESRRATERQVAEASTSPARSGAESPAHIGDIYRAEALSGDSAALVLVTSVDEKDRTVAVTLLSPDIDMHGRDDTLLSRAESGLAYPVLAHRDVSGRIWIAQLRKRLGKVAPDIVTRLFKAPASRENMSAASQGFKSIEVARLFALVSHSIRRGLWGGARLTIDPLAFAAPESFEDAERLREFMVETFEAIRLNEIELPAWLVDIVLSDEVVAAYREYDCFDVYSELVHLAVEQPFDDDPVPDIRKAARDEASAAVALNTYVEHAESLGAATVLLMTSKRAAGAVSQTDVVEVDYFTRNAHNFGDHEQAAL